MEINLSEEMIEKVMCVAFGRIRSLELRKREIERSRVTDRRKQQQLKDIDSAIEDAKEVHSLFAEFAESI